MPRRRKAAARKQVGALTHDRAKRTNIPTAELEPVMEAADKAPIRLAYERRNRELDPQLVWRGKDAQDEDDLVVEAPPLYVQEKIHPKALIDSLARYAGERREAAGEEPAPDLFADFNGLPPGAARTEFYRHDANWSNRMILGDSLRVMASLAEREGLRGKVQCIYIDPPYGIRFNSNFQWSTTSRDVRDGKAEHITREPEQVKAFRDTWRDGVHSYLTYLRDRLTAARDLLAETGSVFVQIGDENVHRVRALMDEVFGETNYIVALKFAKTAGLGGRFLDETYDYLLWFAKDKMQVKFRRPYLKRERGRPGAIGYTYAMSGAGSFRKIDDVESVEDERIFTPDNLTSQTGNDTTIFEFSLYGRNIDAPVKGGWKSNRAGIDRLIKAGRIIRIGNTPRYVRYFRDAPYYPIGSTWGDTGISGFGDEKLYVVQTLRKVVERCILMATDPGDLVMDPTGGSGTTAYVAEQWGRRWIAIDTSRVAMALARARIMGGRHPWYVLADSPEGQRKEAELARRAPSERPAGNDVRQGFVYERVPRITLKSIANNAEIDTIWEDWQETLEPLRAALNAELGEDWEEWEVPREAADSWPEAARELHASWRKARIERQKEIDACIAAKADYEFLYDKPCEDKGRVRVAGPFTVESLSPHRTVPAEAAGPGLAEPPPARDFSAVALEHLRTEGVRQARKDARIDFSAVEPWPGELICAIGRYAEGEAERRAGIAIGPEFGTVARPDLVAAAREAAEAGCDILVSCAFGYEANAAGLDALGRVRILKARINADMHMAGELKNTGKGALFVVFGEPDIEIRELDGDRLQVRIAGVDIYKPNTGEIQSDGADGIACWFIDTDYDAESFFVRHAYFLGGNDPYKALKTSLKAEIDPEAWAALKSDTSRPFPRPASGRIAVKVVNCLGDEAMKAFRV